MLGCAVSVGHRANALLINNALLSCPALTGGFHALNKASRAPMELNTHTILPSPLSLSKTSIWWPACVNTTLISFEPRK